MTTRPVHPQGRLHCTTGYGYSWLWPAYSNFSFADSYFTEMTPALAAAGREEVACEVLRDAIRDVRRIGLPLAENHLLSVVAVVE